MNKAISALIQELWEDNSKHEVFISFWLQEEENSS